MHLVNEDSEGPPINGFSMSLIEDDLGSDVLGCTTDSECSALVEDLGEAKIGKFEIAVIANEQIFRFEIPEDDVFAMQILKARCNRGSIEPKIENGRYLACSVAKV
jgi:hypothetical protein